jgi:GDP-4-dehydro-6-deoxy-D-mannose reductase
MSEVLWITGASGFTGRHLVAFILGQPNPPRIVSLDVTTSPASGVASHQTVDLTDPQAVGRVASLEPPTWVIHLAGLMPPADDAAMWRANVGGTIGLLLGLAAAGQRPRVVSVGSAAEYDPRIPSPLSENAPGGGASHYGNSKLAQSLTCLALARDRSIEAIVARPFNLIGPGLPQRLVVGTLVHQFASGTDEIKIGNPDTARDFIDVRDAVRAYWLLARHGRSETIYNVCSGRSVRVSDVMTLLARITGRSPNIVVDPARVRPQDPVAVFGSFTRLREATDWEPAISLEQSLREMLACA